MPSPNFNRDGGREEVFRRLSQLESQRKEAGEIVQRWFRFRARRGLGVFYSLLSFVPVLGSILGVFSNSESVIFAGVTVAVIFAWIFGRIAGVQSFGKMTRTIHLLKDNAKKKSNSTYNALPTFVLVVLWPWVAYAVASVRGLSLYEVFFALVWLVELVLYRTLTIHRNKNPILEQKAEDWLVIFAFPLAAIISALRIIPNESGFLAFLLISPFILIAGVKSLYDAPKELVNYLDE